MGLQENLAALYAAREAGSAKRKKRVSQLVSLVTSIPDPEPPLDDSIESSLGQVQTRLHSLGDGHGHSSAAEVKGLNAEFNKSLSALIKASGGKAKVTSGFRSSERQAQLWNDALKKYGSPEAARRWVAPPGRSNHNHGLAADLSYSDVATRKWIHDNAAKYGLVFPLKHEPWHIEPINARAKRKK